MSRKTRNSALETGRPNATRSALDDDEARLQRWCDRTERLAEGVAVVAMSLALIALALIAIEWVRLYRSLPPGSMRLCGFVL